MIELDDKWSRILLNFHLHLVKYLEILLFILNQHLIVYSIKILDIC